MRDNGTGDCLPPDIYTGKRSQTPEYSTHVNAAMRTRGNPPQQLVACIRGYRPLNLWT
jgi:hypothetical protein